MDVRRIWHLKMLFSRRIVPSEMVFVWGVIKVAGMEISCLIYSPRTIWRNYECDYREFGKMSQHRVHSVDVFSRRISPLVTWLCFVYFFFCSHTLRHTRVEAALVVVMKRNYSLERIHPLMGYTSLASFSSAPIIYTSHIILSERTRKTDSLKCCVDNLSLNH